MPDPQSNGPQWERTVLEKVALSAIQEQRSARRWGVFFKSAFLIYLIALLVIGFNFLGDGLRDLTDPRRSQRALPFVRIRSSG